MWAGAVGGSSSVAEAAAAHLRRMLLRGVLPAGQELRDTDIASRLGIARPTARAAVAALVGEGLLERRPGHSARVRTFTAADVRDIHRLRRLVEGEAVRAIVAGDLDTTGIRDALAAFGRAGDDWENGPDADVRFHLAVVEAAGSPRLTRTFRSVGTEMRLLVALLRTRYRSLGELYDEHSTLLAALEAGDLDDALHAWDAHLDDAEAFLVAAFDRPGTADAPDPAASDPQETR